MHTLDISKLVIDLLLTGSLAAIALRMARSPGGGGQTRQGAELEAALRGLVRDAETQSKSLNDQLMKREQTLQKLLGEIQGAETRIRTSMEAATTERTALDASATKAQRSVDEVSRALDLLKRELAADERPEPPAPQRAAQPSAPAPRPSHIPIELELEQADPPAIADSRDTPKQMEKHTEPPTPRFEQAVAPARSAGTLADWSLQAHRASSQSPIEAEAATTIQATIVSAPKNASTDAVTDVYTSAERLLKAGRAVSSVSQTTNIPIEEVRKLSKMIEKDKVLEEARSGPVVVADPRLGVLGKGKSAPIGG